LALLASDQFGASEIDVFNGVAAWLAVTKDRVTGASIDRTDKTKILLSQIRFGQMQLKVKLLGHWPMYVGSQIMCVYRNL
jgi:hypothetical protein